MSQLIIPTATNFLTFVNAKILEARRQGAAAKLEFESQRRRAWMIVNETTVLPVTTA